MADPIYKKLSSPMEGDDKKFLGIELLKAFGPDGMKSWLLLSLEKYFFQGEGRYAFRPVELWIGMDVDISLDLYAIYNELSAEQQQTWRYAIADALAQMPHEERQVPIFECLLMLTKIIPANEVLSVLPRVLDVGWFNADQSSIDKDMFSKTLLTVADMAVQTKAARNCIQLLTTTRQFRAEPRYAPLAFITLCRIDPDNWPEHLERLRYQINLSIREYGLSGAATTRLAQRFVDAVKPDRVFSKPKAFVLDNHFREFAVTDRWLWESLFVGPNSLFETLPFEADSNREMSIARYILRNDPTNVFSFDRSAQHESMGSVRMFLPTPTHPLATSKKRNASHKDIWAVIKRVSATINARYLSPAKAGA